LNVKLSTALLALMLATGVAAAQQSTTPPPTSGDPSREGADIGVAGAVAATMEQQEKAPSDSVFVDVPPVVKKKAEPVYPKLAMMAGIEGKVYLRLWVDTEGKVHEVRVMKSDHDVLNQSAVDAARQFEFAPATVGGKPVSVWIVVPFKFKIAGKTDGADIKGLPVGLQGAVGCIMTLLSEKDVAKCMSALTPDAYAVIGTRYMPLADAIERRGTAKGLPDERGWELSMVQTIMDDGAQQATLLLRTANKKSGAYRFHTVVCVRSGEGEWRIRHWHTGQ
jgi:TonB family protein